MEQGVAKKVLYIEDEKAFFKVVASKLEETGFEVIGAGDGEKGVEVAIKEQPAVVIVDIMLPGIDGWAVVRELRRDPWGINVPIIMLTSLTAQKPVDDPITQSTIYLEKTGWNLEDVAKIVNDAYEVYSYYQTSGEDKINIVELTGKIKQRMGLQ